MQMFEVVIRCRENPDKHAKKIRVDAKLGREWVEGWAGLLTGDSPFFIYPPGPGSPIGKCAICGGKLMAEINEVEDAKSEK